MAPSRRKRPFNAGPHAEAGYMTASDRHTVTNLRRKGPSVREGHDRRCSTPILCDRIITKDLPMDGQAL
jgi:hypothetical protein